MKKIKRNIFIAVGLLLLAGGIVFSAGIFPVARVNGETILFREYSQYRTLIERFQNQANELQGGILNWSELEEISEADLPRVALERLIVQKVQKDALESEADSSVKRAVEQSFNALLKDKEMSDLERGSRDLFGASFDQLKSLLLLPKMRTLVLQKIFNTEGKNYEIWINTHLQSADVTIYFLPYQWKDGKLVER